MTQVVSLEKLNTSGSNVNAISGNILIGPSYNSSWYATFPYQSILILNNSGTSNLSNNQIADTSVITFQGGNGYGAGVFRLNNMSETIGGIQSVGNGDGLVQNNALVAGTSTLTLLTISGQNTNFSGIIQNHDNANFNRGVLALTVTGAGTQQLSNVNTYSGTTTVTGSATLIVSGSLTSSSVTVTGSTATLAGTGSIAQNVTVNRGGRLAPRLYPTFYNFGAGSTLSLATAGTLTLTNANLDFNLDTTAVSTNNDKIVAGTLSLGSTIIFNFSQLTPGTLEMEQLYPLIVANSGISGFDFRNITTNYVNGTPYTATYMVVGNNLDVIFTEVPEPRTWILLLVGLGLLNGFHRKKGHQQ